MNFFVFLILTSAVLFSREPSAFESQSGATKNELKSLREYVDSYTDKIISMERQMQNLNTSFEGLSSVNHSQSSKLKEVNDDIDRIDNKSGAINKDIIELKSKMEVQDESIKLLSDSLSNIKNSISQIRDMLKDIENDANKSEQIPKEVFDEDKNKVNGIENDFIRDVNKAEMIFKEARSMTYNNRFKEAIDRYKWLIEVNYKKAEATYMLGNIAYAQNKYNYALYYYKESASIDDKAKYMPRLLLNTANSFRVLNDIDNAKKFYNSLISLFPNSTEVKEANRHLDKLK